MNIAPLLSYLSEKSRNGFIACLSKIQAQKKIRQNEIDHIFDEQNVSGNKTAAIFGISVQALNKWVKDGCPQNSDKTYSLPAVYNWRIDRAESKNEAPVGLKEQKLEKEIEFLQARINEKQDQYIERSLFETIQVSRASTLRIFLEKTFMANSVHLAGKTVDEVRTILYKLVQSAMDAYVGNTTDGN